MTTRSPTRLSSSFLSLSVCGLLATFALHASPAHADIFRWDNHQLIPGTENITPGPGVNLSNWNTPSHNLEYAALYYNLTGANFTNSDLSYAYLTGPATIITNANFTNATITGVNFQDATRYGFTAAQLYSTRSYATGNLTDINFTDDALVGWNFAGKNLSNADFCAANITSDNFTGATINGTRFDANAGFTLNQLYSTASYRNKDLSNVRLFQLDLRNANFTGQNLFSANFQFSNLSGANFVGANLGGAFLMANLTGADLSGDNLYNVSFLATTLTGANLRGAYVAGAEFLYGASLSPQQLYTTASYTNHDLHGIRFQAMNVSGWDFSAQDLTGATFFAATASATNFSGASLNGASLSQSDLTSASFKSADLTGASFVGANLTAADLTGAVVNRADFSAPLPLVAEPFANSPGAAIASYPAPSLFPAGGLTAAQLYTTESYKNRDLRNIRFAGLNLIGWSFAQQNLTDASFSYSASAPSTTSGLLVVSQDLSGPPADLTAADFTGAVVTGANFGSVKGFTPAQLYSTASYANGNLTGIGLSKLDLSGWSFANQLLKNASFSSANLTNADFTGAIVTGTKFSAATGFSAAQLYSTASYANSNLRSIDLSDLDLTAWNFAAKNLSQALFTASNLTGANFAGANLANATFGSDSGLIVVPFGDAPVTATSTTSPSSIVLPPIWRPTPPPPPADLTNANFRDADLRGATGWNPLASTITANTIRPDGNIHGLNLASGETLVIRNHPIRVEISQAATADPASTLRFLLDADWTSTVHFTSSVDPSLKGTLALDFAPGADVIALIGETFDLFAWNGPISEGDRFSAIDTDPGFRWDLSQLYTDGTVTLLAAPGDWAASHSDPVPEPASLALLLPAALLLLRRRTAARSSRP